MKTELLTKVKLYDNLAINQDLVLDLPLYAAQKSVEAATGKDVVLDRSKSHNNGVVTGAIWTPQGRSLDNIDDGIVIPDADSLDVTAITVEVWLNRNAELVQFTGVVHKPSNRYLLYFSTATERPEFYVTASGGSTGVLSADSLTINTWYHICGTYDSVAGMVLYVNTVSKGTAAAQGTILASVTDMQIGRQAAAAPFLPFGGIIGEVRIYNRALTAAEVMRNYFGTKWRYGL